MWTRQFKRTGECQACSPRGESGGLILLQGSRDARGPAAWSEVEVGARTWTHS